MRMTRRTTDSTRQAHSELNVWASMAMVLESFAKVHSVFRLGAAAGQFYKEWRGHVRDEGESVKAIVASGYTVGPSE